MKVFRVETDGGIVGYRGTQAEAHKLGKECVNKTLWGEVVITVCEVQTDKEGVVAMLNDEPVMTLGDKLGLTRRGALEPIKD